MGRDLFIGLGLGLVLYPAVGYLEKIPFVGQYMTLLAVVLGIVFLIKGYMK